MKPNSNSRAAGSFHISWIWIAGMVLGAVILSPGASLAVDQENCLMCHQNPRLARIDDKGISQIYHVDKDLFNHSIHRKVSCKGCHINIKEIPHRAVIEPVDCGTRCHMKDPFTNEYFSHQKTVEVFQQSSHAVKPDDSDFVKEAKPNCKFCHANPLYELAEDEVPPNAVERCKNCHQQDSVDVAFRHVSHRLKKKVTRPPKQIVELCSKECHEDQALMKKVGLSDVGIDAVETYKETLHWRVIQFGAEKAADCVGCHATSSIHDIRGQKDKASSIYPEERFKVCQQEGCHPSATPAIAAIDSHLAKNQLKSPILYYLEEVMLGITIFTLLFLFTLIGLESYGRIRNRDARFFRWKRRPQPLPKGFLEWAKAREGMDEKSLLSNLDNLHRHVECTPRGDYKRYSLHIRIQHLFTVITFVVAIMTGLPIFFHNTGWALWINRHMGGIDVTRIIHRVNAVLFIANAAYHILTLAVGTLIKIRKGEFALSRTMFPMPRDVMDLFKDVKYFLGLSPTRPKMEKFMYKQKFHYLALVWGNTVLIVSGLCLLFPVAAVKLLPYPSETFNILRLFHAEESLLATLVILYWHLYNVHLAPGRFPMQWVWLTGRISRDHQIEEHRAEYERQLSRDKALAEDDQPVQLLKESLGKEEAGPSGSEISHNSHFPGEVNETR